MCLQASHQTYMHCAYTLFVKIGCATRRVAVAKSPPKIRHWLNVVLAIAFLSVRLSFARRYCVKTNERSASTSIIGDFGRGPIRTSISVPDHFGPQ